MSADPIRVMLAKRVLKLEEELAEARMELHKYEQKISERNMAELRKPVDKKSSKDQEN